jgi:MFS family permease
LLLTKNNVNFTEIFYLPYEREFKSEKRKFIKTCSFGSLIGTTIEFFDFYIYANAAVLVFPQLFSFGGQYQLVLLLGHVFDSISRPLGSAVFGHYGDKAQNYVGNCFIDDGYFNSFHWFYLVMPASESLPLLLMLCRFGQGVGLGGEWGGAVLLAIENAPPNKRAWYGMFPQLGAPIGLLLSGGTFLILTDTMSSQDFLDYGWNSYIASSLLVVVGFYIRLK